ncbi:MAG: FliM/FliN family flagellar motor switch protein [Actinobacteria bacterium]|nr:FliM/FliN family flagellar motor switch protein [Actinomycetota bacterium]
MDQLHQVDRVWEPFDLCRPTKLTREQLHSLDIFHATFTQQLSIGVGRLARSSATTEMARTSQLSWEEFIRTLPRVTTLITASATELPDDLVIELDTSLALALASRLLGGAGRIEPQRRPSELELPALRRIGAIATDALGEALRQFMDVQTTMTSLDLSPQLLSVPSPSQVVLVLTYSLSLPLLGVDGDVNVTVPLTSLSPIFDRLSSRAQERANLDSETSPMQVVTERVPIEVQATLTPTMMNAVSVAALVPGDVIVLDHRSGQPTTVSVGSVEVFRGHLGRRGSRLAIAVSSHSFAPSVTKGLQTPGHGPPPGPVAGHGQHGHSLVTHDGHTFDDERQHDARDPHASTSPVHSLR